MSDSFTLNLTRTRALLIGACFLAASLLLFVAGAASGLLLASASGNPALEKEMPIKLQTQPKAPVAAPAAQPGAAADDSAPTSASGTAAPSDALSASMTSLVAVPPAPPPAAPGSSAKTAADKKTASADAVPSGDSVSDAIPLAIRVCAFTAKASAQSMIDDLALKGYHATLAHGTGANGHPWYVVRLGPYTEWNTASTIASRVAIAENVRPVVGPMRY